MSSMSESHWWYLFDKQWRADTLQSGLGFDNFKPRLKSCIFKSISWLNSSFFGWWWSGFSERGMQDLSNGTIVNLLTRQLISVFTSIVYESPKAVPRIDHTVGRERWRHLSDMVTINQLLKGMYPYTSNTYESRKSRNSLIIPSTANTTPPVATEFIDIFTPQQFTDPFIFCSITWTRGKTAIDGTSVSRMVTWNPTYVS
jgi:hypothetical protein